MRLIRIEVHAARQKVAWPPILILPHYLMCGCWVIGLKLSRQIRRGLNLRGRWIVGLRNFDSEDITFAEHVTREDHEFLIGREADVGFKPVIVVRHVDEML